MKKYEDSFNLLKNSYEQFFNINEDNPSFKLLTGNIDGIIFSCPHAVSQMRNGKEKLADIHTGPLAVTLHSLGYSVLLKTKNCNDDANYDKKSDFKNFLYKYVKNNNIKYLIDLHGMSKKRNVLISLGTNFGVNSDATLELTNQFIKIAQQNGIDVNKTRIDFPFSASKRTISSFIARKNKIETLQIEINSKLFEDESLTKALIKTIDEYAQLLIKVKDFGAKKQIINKINYYESQFNNTSSNKVFELINRNSNILITAPHSCAMIEEGKECYKETFSGALVKSLSENFELSSCYKIQKTQYNSTEEYLENITKFTLNKKIKLVIEFHIMNPQRYEDITIVTNQGFSINNNFEIMSIFIKSFILNSFTNLSLDYPFNAQNYNSSVMNIFKQTHIPALQLIINQRIFENKIKTNKLLKALKDIIKRINLTI